VVEAMIYSPVKAIFKIIYSNIEVAKLVFDSIQPDNTNLPPYIEVQSTIRNNVLMFKIKSWKKLGSLFYAIDDLLQCISSIEKVKAITNDLNS